MASRCSTSPTRPTRRRSRFWERGPLSATRSIGGGTWSAYYYNGHIYSNDIVKGLDVLELNDWRTWSAKLTRYQELNVQTQPSYLGW